MASQLALRHGHLASSPPYLPAPSEPRVSGTRGAHRVVRLTDERPSRSCTARDARPAADIGRRGDEFALRIERLYILCCAHVSEGTHARFARIVHFLYSQSPCVTTAVLPGLPWERGASPTRGPRLIPARWCSAAPLNDIERGLPDIRARSHPRLRHLERKGSCADSDPFGRAVTSTTSRMPVAPSNRPDRDRRVGGAVDVRRTGALPRSDPITLTWWMHRRLDVDNLPDRRVVVEFDTPTRRRCGWCSPGEPSVCVKHPGSTSTSSSRPTRSR